VVIALLIGCIYLFPNLLPAIVFSTYIGTGHTLDLPTAVTILVLFNMMKGPLISLPMFFSDLIDLLVSMKRIQRFVQTDEVQKNIVQVQATSEDGNALQIKGNFSWGMRIKKDNDEEDQPDPTAAKTEVKKTDEENINATADNLTQLIEENKEETKTVKDDKKTLSKFVQLKNIDLQIKEGEFVCIVGDVGSGKSSLLHSIIGDMIYVP
jgi:ATP-binding cassette, subfamily C (CFTR/MRP), member 1